MRKSKSKNKLRKDAMMVWDIPPSLRMEFKAACALRGVSMRQAVMTLLIGYIRQTDRLTKVPDARS